MKSVTAQNNIIDELNIVRAGQGEVRVYEDESIAGLIGTKSLNINSESSNYNYSTENAESSSTDAPAYNPSKTTNFRQVKGYKIQVFSGNDQRRSKNEAQIKKNQISNAFPGTEVVVIFNSPVWRVRAGNYRTYEEAYQALNDMKKAFPSFGKEMQIVESTIKIPIY